MSDDELLKHLDINHNHEAGLIPVATRAKIKQASTRIREMEAELAFYKGFHDGVCKNGTHVVVPVEPTLGQRIAGAEKFKELTDGIEAGKLLIGHVYRAMIREKGFCATSVDDLCKQAAIDQQAAVIAELVEALEKIESFTLVDACRAVAAKSLRKHKAGK